MENPHAPAWHPAQLPPGTKVGYWRVEALHGQGTYGAVYRAVSVGQDEPVPVALKLALNAGDPRFAREVKLLSRLDHPSIPRVLDHRVWRHPSGAPYPYLVMEWVEGTPVYAWAGEHNLTSRQVFQLLGQLARALQATHAAGAVHRDVKGANVLVRHSDRRAMLIDFGSTSYRGAARLTWQSQPPGTPAYRSPEAWEYLLRFGIASDAHYVAGPPDDLFALGLTLYRLVTGEYPPSTEPGADKERTWHPEGPGPKPPLALNPRVEPGLSALILRILAVNPEARGTAEELAEAAELAVERTGPAADQLLFERKPQPLPAPAEAAVPAPVKSAAERLRPRAHALTWLPWLAAATVVLLLWGWQAVHVRAERVFARTQTAPDAQRLDADTSAMGDTALTAPVAFAEPPSEEETVAEDAPPELFPRQATPNAKGRCPSPGQVAINGGCWVEQALKAAACEQNGYLIHQGKCYAPAFSGQRKRRRTSSPTDPR